MVSDERIIQSFMATPESVTSVAGVGAVEAARRLLSAKCPDPAVVHMAGMVLAKQDMVEYGVKLGIPRECEHPWRCTSIDEVLSAVPDGVTREVFFRIRSRELHPGYCCDKFCSHNPQEDFYRSSSTYSDQVVTSNVGEPDGQKCSVIPDSW